MEVTFAFILAGVTLVAFLLGGAHERWQTRKAWHRGDRTEMGLKEERRREAEQGQNA